MLRRLTHRRIAVATAVIAVALVTALASGCSRDDVAEKARTYAESRPAALAVAAVLELRADDVRDPDAYAPYFESSAVATALAEASDVPTGTPRVPGWEHPYVSAETSSTAEVVVVWKPAKAFPDWPAVNVFMTRLEGERWVIVDAVEATSAPAPVAEPE